MSASKGAAGDELIGRRCPEGLPSSFNRVRVQANYSRVVATRPRRRGVCETRRNDIGKALPTVNVP